MLERLPVKTSDCAQRFFIPICGAVISGINTKTESEMQEGGQRKEG